MKQTEGRHQEFEYQESAPFHFYNVLGCVGDETLLSHWHEELEMAFCLKGYPRHYINGECIQSQPGRLVVTNSGFVHNIIQDEDMEDSDEIVAVVVIVEPGFLKACFPEYESLYFLNDQIQASQEIRETMKEISQFAAKRNTIKPDSHTTYDDLYGKSLVLKLLYHMCNSGIVSRDEAPDVAQTKNIERIKDIICYIEQHYTEGITQKQVADRFYFSQVYFSRYFKKCMGVTFTEYMTRYRLQKAREDLLHTKKSVCHIALDHGFSDDRRLILAFKEKYGMTPLKYRKKNMS